jgi:hypothetical protein
MRTISYVLAVGGGLLMSAGTGAAMAQSVVLPPGGIVPTPSTTAAVEPSLAGTVIHDALVPFTIRDARGRLLCAGHLQDRVVRSGRRGRLDFYYRVRDTRGIGAINQINTSGFGGLGLRVGYRTDGLGTVPPRRASRSGGAGSVVSFALNDPPVSCRSHSESRFILIRTPVRAFRAGGATRIIATTGKSVLVRTVRP